MGNVLGGCSKGPTWTHDAEGNICVTIPNCVTGEDLKITPHPEIPPDQFAVATVSDDGKTVSILFPDNPTPVVLKLTPVDSAVMVASDGTETEIPVDADCTLRIPQPDPICWGLDENGCPVLNIKNCVTGEDLVIESVLEVTGNVVDNTDPKRPVVTAVASVEGNVVDNTDPLNPIVTAVATVTGAGVDNTDPLNPVVASSTTVASPAGFHTITTDDGIATPVCLEPVKDVLDPLGLSLVTDGVAQLVDHLVITEAADGKTGTVTNTLTGDTCVFLKQVDFPADIRVDTYDMVTVANPDGSTSYQFTITLTDGTVLPAGPVIDMDKFGSVVDNGNGTGSVTDPVTGLLCTFQKPITSLDGSVTITDGTDLSVPPAAVVPDEWSASIVVPAGGTGPTAPTVAGTCSKVLDPAGNLIGTVDDDGYHPIVHPTPAVVEDEWSASIVVADGGAFPTAPTTPDTYSQVLDSAGNLLGTVDADGYHPIDIPDVVDEWSTSITVAAGGAAPVAPTVPGTCAKVLDPAGNLIGTVDDDGYHPIVHPSDPNPVVATVAGIDFFGQAYEVGGNLLVWEDGRRVCIPAKPGTPVTGDAVDADRGAIVGPFATAASFVLSDNDVPCSEGVTTWELRPSGHVNIASITGFDNTTGAYTKTSTGFGPWQVAYDMFCDGVLIDSAVDYGVINEPVAVTADAIDIDRGLVEGPSGSTFSFVLSDNDVWCSGGAVTTYALDPAGHVNVAAITGFNATNGAYTVEPAVRGPVTVAYDLLCDGSVVDSAVDTMEFENLEKRCGLLPELLIIPAMVSSSGPTLNALNLIGEMHYFYPGTTIPVATAVFDMSSTVSVDTVALPFTAGGTDSTDSNQPSSIYDDAETDTVLGGGRVGFRATGAANTESGGNKATLEHSPVVTTTDLTTDVNGCPAGPMGQIHRIIDFDQGSVLTNMFREPDANFPEDGSSSTPDESPAGTWKGNVQSNWTFEWESDTLEVITYDYEQWASDGFQFQHRVKFRPPVCVFVEYGTDTIVSAEALDGDMAPADFGLITLTP